MSTPAAIQIDESDAGTGPGVVLVHSSASGNRQWRSLTDTLKDRYRVIAVNLYGYGKTPPWTVNSKQSLVDQADLFIDAPRRLSDRVTLVGHSLGAAVALAAALRLGADVRGLILFEPILFYLLRQHGLADAFAEINAMATEFRKRAQQEDWENAGEVFVDYWSGAGTWAALSAQRKAGLLKMLPNVVHEWDAVISDGPSLADLKAIDVPVHLVRAADTRRPTHAITTLLAGKMNGWRLHELPAGGHMAPVTRPDLFDPLVKALLAELQ